MSSAGKSATIDVIGDAKKAVHGNSKASTNTQHGYQITDKDNNVMEFGISGQKLKQNGESPRIDQKLKTKYKNNPNYKGEILKKNMENRKNGLDWERKQVEDYKATHGTKPPMQIRP